MKKILKASKLFTIIHERLLINYDIKHQCNGMVYVSLFISVIGRPGSGASERGEIWFIDFLYEKKFIAESSYCIYICVITSEIRYLKNHLFSNVSKQNISPQS